MRSALLLAILCSAAPGCGTSGSSSPASNGPADASADGEAVGAEASGGPAQDSPATVDASSASGFCAGFLRALADFVVRCDGASPASAQGFYADPVICQRFETSVAAGRTRFDPSSAAACLAAMQGSATPCEGSSVQPPACAGVITPLVPRGGVCQSFYLINASNECTGDDFCARASMDACTGTCTARSPVGTTCYPLTPDVRCATDARCDLITNLCVTVPPAVELGQPCGAAGQGACATGLYCDRSASEGGASGVCQNKKSSGACTATDECALPAHCAGATGAKTCRPFTALGASCTAGWGECGLYSACLSGRCTDVPAPVGQPCGAIGGENIVCADAAYCDSSRVCRAKKQPGDTCTGTPSLGECAGNGGHCNATTHTCASCPP